MELLACMFVVTACVSLLALRLSPLALRLSPLACMAVVTACMCVFACVAVVTAMRCVCHRLRLIKHAYMQVICQFLNKLGCVLPSEPTSASIAAAVCVARFGPRNSCELPQYAIDGIYEFIKSRIKQLYKKEEPGQFIQVLPSTPGELLSKYRDAARALYSRDTPPVRCPLNQSAMAMVRSRVSMRGINRMRRSLTGKLMHPPCMHVRYDRQSAQYIREQVRMHASTRTRGIPRCIPPCHSAIYIPLRNMHAHRHPADAPADGAFPAAAADANAVPVAAAIPAAARDDGRAARAAASSTPAADSVPWHAFLRPESRNASDAPCSGPRK